MIAGIMQPYFLPYIGYFQLINAVDEFVIYDNIQYTKKGWINRNRFLLNNSDSIFTIPIKKDSDYLDVSQRSISDDFNTEKLLNKIYCSYHKAPYFNETYKILKEIIEYKERNLFEYIFNSVKVIINHLNIETKIIKSSTIDIDHNLKGQDKVIALCKELNAEYYINSIGGVELYSKSEFKKYGIQIDFLKSQEIKYKQFNEEFIPWLSILDILMFNDIETVRNMLNCYEVQ